MSEKTSLRLINNEVAAAATANRLRECASPFEDIYGAAWFAIEETNSIVGKLNKPVFDLDNEHAEVVFLMLFNSLSDIISGVYTLSSGWIRPSVTALRGALETVATAITIHHDPLKMTSFVEGKLDIPKSVSSAKLFLPSIGRLYGALTGQWTHETFDTTARSIHGASRRLLLVPEMHPENTPIYSNVFVEAATLAQLVGIALETCFPGLSDGETHFAVDRHGKRVRSAAPSSKAIRLAVEARDRLPKP